MGAAIAVETIVNVWSSTKTVTSLAALIVAVAAYRPGATAQDASRGRRGEDTASHTSSVSGWQEPITIEDLYDWDKSTSLLAAQAP